MFDSLNCLSIIKNHFLFRNLRSNHFQHLIFFETFKLAFSFLMTKTNSLMPIST